MCVGCPWRDIPSAFCDWNMIYRRFNLWSKKGITLQWFTALMQLLDFEWKFIDSGIVRTHQHATGASTNERESIAKSCGGNTTKIHLVVDSYGLPINFLLTGGEVHDSKLIRELVKKNGGKPVIPRKTNSKICNADIDWCLYKYRHLVENAFARLKHYRAISTRYDKLARNYAGTGLLHDVVAYAKCMKFRQQRSTGSSIGPKFSRGEVVGTCNVRRRHLW
jgi:transposase